MSGVCFCELIVLALSFKQLNRRYIMTSFIEDIDEQNDLINEANNAPKVSSNAFECSKRQKNMTWKKRLLQLYQQCQGSSSNHDNRGLGMGSYDVLSKTFMVDRNLFSNANIDPSIPKNR